jgi:hypothetical protein
MLQPDILKYCNQVKSSRISYVDALCVLCERLFFAEQNVMSSFRVVFLSISVGSHSEYLRLSVSASLVPICGGWSLPFDKVEL